MGWKNANPNIRCNVSSCSYHCDDKQCCSLDSIDVKTVIRARPIRRACAEATSASNPRYLTLSRDGIFSAAAYFVQLYFFLAFFME